MTNQLNNFENVLVKIQSQYISLPDHEVRRNNEILNKVVNQITTAMKADPLFLKLFTTKFYGGSYFDGLRVGKPEEFDLDFLLKVPKLGKPELSGHTNEPGFLNLKFNAPEELSDDFKRKMLDDKNYLSSTKVMQWMQSVFMKAMNQFKVPNGTYEFKGDTYRLMGKLSQSGPAMTLILNGNNIKIDVDLVPCFEFSGDKWPTGGYKKNPVSNKSSFFIVPKSPKNIDHHKDRYWRLSFQEQERELMNGKRTLKPTLKLMKRLRDTLQHKAIASYYIKTIFLWEQEKHGASYWDGTLTDTFLKMLDVYIEYIESGKIPYFWNKKNNLLNISSDTHANMKNRLKVIRKDIVDKYKTEPLVICKYLNTPLQSPVVAQSAQHYSIHTSPLIYPAALPHTEKYLTRSSSITTYKDYHDATDNGSSLDRRTSTGETSQDSGGISKWAIAGMAVAGVGALVAGLAGAFISSSDNKEEDDDEKATN